MFGYAPVEAAEKALRRAGIGWSDIGAVELNEAFAVQSLACIDAWGIDPEIVNARAARSPSVIRWAPPAAASSARWSSGCGTGQRWGVAAICIGVGQGLAVVLENEDALTSTGRRSSRTRTRRSPGSRTARRCWSVGSAWPVCR